MQMDRRSMLVLTATAPLATRPALAAPGHTSSKARHVATAKAFLKAIEGGETESLRRFLTTDYVQYEMPNAANPKGQTRGLDKTIEGAKKGVELLEWQRYNFTNVIGNADWVVVESDWQAKLKGSWGKLPPGFVFDAKLAIFMKFHGGKISLSRDYDTYKPFKV